MILVVCELQSAPIDQRICIYLRWIVHGEEEALYDALHNASAAKVINGNAERLPANASVKKDLQSFEVIKYIPSWQLKVGPRASPFSPQPFRIDLSDALQDNSSGFFEVSVDGNLAVDLTLCNPDRCQSSKQVSTRVRLRSTKFSPWQSSSSLPMGSRGPEGLIQHLGPLLPLHCDRSEDVDLFFRRKSDVRTGSEDVPQLPRKDLQAGSVDSHQVGNNRGRGRREKFRDPNSRSEERWVGSWILSSQLQVQCEGQYFEVVTVKHCQSR
ncbi:hypothetical protein PHSY_000815 [Pseudozyma hubeiensis SY62]|uniref:Uncharacterized protein n=1 Tax=Pseudozyma hubeiensis (strain SY62) TaxID=1305764 RepID=R9NXE4_PSEHS|nr:hypothetical protein PHSY_000815 [Pseudozyma hubeiensis SY62]GAC93251.1 hypothetical protein PHSY_000815 [Pseudozyma hubeiensis SY62]